MTGVANQEQADYWSSPAGARWVEYQETLDTTLAPALDCLLAAAALQSGARVLDIGCGTGASSLAAATAVGPQGAVTGVDISPVMLACARQRAARAGLKNVDFIEADAQTEPFDPAGHDAMISRFGVMFFSDPVAAFANIGRALVPGGRMTFIAWGRLADNPWFGLPLRAAAERLGPLDPPAPRAPGPMAFAEQDYVTDILARAGLTGISARAVTLDLTPPGTAAEVAEFATRFGPAARVLAERNGTEEDARAIAATLRAELDPFVTPHGVRVPALFNLFQAEAPRAAP